MDGRMRPPAPSQAPMQAPPQQMMQGGYMHPVQMQYMAPMQPYMVGQQNYMPPQYMMVRPGMMPHGMPMGMPQMPPGMMPAQHSGVGSPQMPPGMMQPPHSGVGTMPQAGVMPMMPPGAMYQPSTMAGTPTNFPPPAISTSAPNQQPGMHAAPLSPNPHSPNPLGAAGSGSRVDPTPAGEVYLSIDVECVATGTKHNDRAVAQIAMVDAQERPVFNLYVQPAQPVVSFLTPLTGLTKELLDEKGISKEEAMVYVRQQLPKDAILVGHNVNADVQWLGLEEGKDFKGMVDLAGLWRVWNDKYNSYSVFGQDHIARCLLGINTESRSHDACEDSIMSMASFNYYNKLKAAGPEELAKAHKILLETAVAPSFAKRNPSFEGCCMGNRKTCTCGAPFFGVR